MTTDQQTLPTFAATKQCARCTKVKTADQFYLNARYSSGLSSYCKRCMKEYSGSWAGDNPDSRAQSRRSSHLKRLYGITADDYATMLAEQGGVCAICLEPQERRALAVDHDHVTGEVRGLLCDNCNHALGKFQDSTDHLRSAITYLEKTKND